MSSSYHFQELIDQNAESVVHRVIAEDGESFVYTRLKVQPEVLAGLYGEGVFENALAKLQSLKCENLREVSDGGMHEDDGSPWVTSDWVEGKPLAGQKLKEKEIRRLGKQCQDLVESLGELAGAVSFDPADVLTRWMPDGEVYTLFSIDYSRWFRDAAAGHIPGGDQKPEKEVRKLLKGLIIAQLKPLVKKREETPIPFVEDRSPALTAYQVPRSNWWVAALAWVGFILTIGVIAWLTLAGMKRMKENPRKEISTWKAR